MNKKILITVFVLLILTFVIGGNITISKIYKEEKIRNEQQEKINYTLSKYEAFSNKEIINNDDAVSKFFNQIITEEEKQEKIDESKLLTNLDDTNNTLTLIEEEIINYDISYLNNINEESLNNIIPEDVDSKTVLEMYQSNELVKNINEEKSKREKYLEYLNELKNDVNYLVENKEYYYKDKETYICKKQDVYTNIDNIKRKYNLNINIKYENIAKEVPILCYHGVLDDAWGATTLFVKVAEFEKQMQYLKENGYTPIFISEIANAGAYEKPVVLTFDDGYKDVYTYAFPILQKYNFKSNFYIISDSIGGDVYVTSEMIKNMSNSGLVEIGSHTVSHPLLHTLSKEEIDYELKSSKERLENIIGKEVTSIAYPSGGYNEDVLDIAKKYYKYGISTDWGKEKSNKLNQYKLKRKYVYREYNLERFKGLL